MFQNYNFICNTCECICCLTIYLAIVTLFLATVILAIRAHDISSFKHFVTINVILAAVRYYSNSFIPFPTENVFLLLYFFSF